MICDVKPVHNKHPHQHEKWFLTKDCHQIQTAFDAGSTVKEKLMYMPPVLGHLLHTRTTFHASESGLFTSS